MLPYNPAIFPTTLPVASAAIGIPWIDLGVFQVMVRAANGWSGLFFIFMYSVLIAVVLPLPSEVVLVPVLQGTLRIGVPTAVAIVFVVVLSSVGKALGSVVALDFGARASHSGPVIDAVRALGFEPLEWSKQRIVQLVDRYGYVGLTAGLSVPGFPDTLSIYAFSVFDLERTRFAAATFLGSVGRLLIILAVLKGSFSFA